MKKQDLLNLKEMYNNVEETIRHTTVEYDTDSCVYYGLRTNIMSRMAYDFLKQHNKYNTTNYDALIDYLSEETSYMNNRVHRMIDEKTYE